MYPSTRRVRSLPRLQNAALHRRCLMFVGRAGGQNETNRPVSLAMGRSLNQTWSSLGPAHFARAFIHSANATAHCSRQPAFSHFCAGILGQAVEGHGMGMGDGASSS